MPDSAITPKPLPIARFAPVVAIVGLLLLLIAVTIQKLWSADFWWQLKNGMYILEHHSIPSVERFSHTSSGTPVREMRWLYCAAIAWLWDHGGPELITLLKAFLVTGAFAVIAWPIRRYLLNPLVLLALGLALVAGMNRWVVRPELMTDVLAAAFLVILERTTRTPERRSTRLLWLLPLLQVLWVNTHSTFVFGPIFVWTFFAADWATAVFRHQGASAGARPSIPLLAVAVLTTAACWVNPYGHWGAMYAVEMFRQTQAGHPTAQIIGEMQSPFELGFRYWGWDHWCGAALCLLGIATSVPIAKRIPLARFAMLLMALYLFATLQRNLGLCAVMLAWINTRNAVDLAAAGVTLRARSPQAEPFAVAVLGLIMAITGWYIASDRYAVSRGLSREFGLGVVEFYQPRGAEAYILEHHPQRELFNDIRDGSYFSWRVSDVMPIYIDGRTDAYPPEFLTELDNTKARNWDEVSARRNVNTAVIPRSSVELAQYLFKSPGWTLVHLDPVSYVFLRNTPENAALIAATRVDPEHWTAPANEPDDRVPAWKAAYGGIGRAWYNAGMAHALAQLGAHQAAIPYFEKAVANAPAVRGYRLELAPYYIVSGKGGEAEQLLQGVSREELADVDRATARFLYEGGQVSAAIAPAMRALDVYPEDHQLRIFVADLYFQTGDFVKARDYYTVALKAGVGTYAELNKLGHACEQTGNLPEAARAYKASLEGEPRQHAVWNMAGNVAAQMGDLRGAKTCFENAVRLKPDSEQYKSNLEKVNQLLANPPAPPQK